MARSLEVHVVSKVVPSRNRPALALAAGVIALAPLTLVPLPAGAAAPAPAQAPAQVSGPGSRPAQGCPAAYEVVGSRGLRSVGGDRLGRVRLAASPRGGFCLSVHLRAVARRDTRWVARTLAVRTPGSRGPLELGARSLPHDLRPLLLAGPRYGPGSTARAAVRVVTRDGAVAVRLSGAALTPPAGRDPGR